MKQLLSIRRRERERESERIAHLPGRRFFTEILLNFAWLNLPAFGGFFTFFLWFLFGFFLSLFCICQAPPIDHTHSIREAIAERAGWNVSYVTHKLQYKHIYQHYKTHTHIQKHIHTLSSLTAQFMARKWNINKFYWHFLSIRTKLKYSRLHICICLVRVKLVLVHRLWVYHIPYTSLLP